MSFSNTVIIVIFVRPINNKSMDRFENYIDVFYDEFDRLGVSKVSKLLNSELKQGELKKESVIETLDEMLEYFKAREEYDKCEVCHQIKLKIK